MPFSSGIADIPVKRRFKEKLSIILKTISKLIHKLGNNFNGMADFFKIQICPNSKSNGLNLKRVLITGTIKSVIQPVSQLY